MANLLRTVIVCLSVIAVTRAASIIERPENDTPANTMPEKQPTENEMVEDLLLIQQLLSLDDSDFLDLLLKNYEPRYASELDTAAEEDTNSASKRSDELVQKRYPMGDFTHLAANVKDKEAQVKLAAHFAGNVGVSSPCLDEMIPRVRTVHDLMEVFRLCR